LKISLTGPAMRDMDTTVGYGEASFHIYQEFKKAGLDVEVERLDGADIELCFADPGNYIFYYPNSYKIGYSAWESTEFSHQFQLNMLACDELWATSSFVANVMYQYFSGKPIFVYNHGIDKSWIPKKRQESNKPFTFFHLGEPYARKGGQIAVDAFVDLFGNDEDYRLIMKSHVFNTTKVKNPKTPGQLSSPSVVYKNIIAIHDVLSKEQMNYLYNISDCFVFPTYGEGFGFNPLQSMALGIPTITTDEWAEYKNLITLPIKSKMSTSPWQNIHPGMQFTPDVEDLKVKMQEVVDNYKKYADVSFKNALKVHSQYDWTKVSKPAVDRLKKIYKNKTTNP